MPSLITLMSAEDEAFISSKLQTNKTCERPPCTQYSTVNEGDYIKYNLAVLNLSRIPNQTLQQAT